jgi:nucleoside-diphosphate-sugar epimerase
MNDSPVGPSEIATTALRIGVLGGAGFIGRRLVRRLAKCGHRVKIGDVIAGPNNDGFEYSRCDVRDYNAVARFIDGLDIVYNLAAEHRDNVRPPERYAAINIGGANAVCEAARRARVPSLVFTSSVAVYGVPDGVANEGSPLRPFNEYGRSKSAAEAVYLRWAAESQGRSLVIVRPAVVFGEGNRGNVFQLAKQVASRRFVMVGDGNNKKSIAYVENVAAFLVHVISLRMGVHIFNYSDGPDMDMNGLVSLLRTSLGQPGKVGLHVPRSVGMAVGTLCDWVARASGRSFPVSAVRVEKFCHATRISAELALQTGFHPHFTVQEALMQFVKHEFHSRRLESPAKGPDRGAAFGRSATSDVSDGSD